MTTADRWYISYVRFALALVFISSCSACGGSDEGANDNHGYGSSYDVQGVSGLRLRYAPTLASSNPFSNAVLYETEFAAVQQCAGLAAPAPFVIIVPAGSLPDNKAGFYLKNPSLILLGNPTVFRHEAVHYLLDMATGDSDHDHRSALFERCAPGEIRLIG